MHGYYDALFTGLVPCKALGRTVHDGTIGHYANLVVEVTKTVKVYKKGDKLSISPRDFVCKAKSQKGAFVRVQTIDTCDLPTI